MSEEIAREIVRSQEPPKEEKVLPVRLAALDPGKMQSGFGMVGIEIESPYIDIIGAMQWKHQEYYDVEKEVDDIQRTIVKRPFQYIIVEKNHSGAHVIEALRRNYHLPIMPITTSTTLKDPKVIRKGNTMDKNDMVGWVRRMIQRGYLRFPDHDSPGTKLLRNQIPKFTRHITPAGNVTFHAPGKENDDLVMALILACYVARRKFLKGTGIPKIQTANYLVGGKKKIKTTEDYFRELQQDPYTKITNATIYGPR